MAASINSITTRTENWQEKCRTWAQAGEPFEIRDMEASQFMFCQEICAEYDYSYQYLCRGPESTAKFTPID